MVIIKTGVCVSREMIYPSALLILRPRDKISVAASARHAFFLSDYYFATPFKFMVHISSRRVNKSETKNVIPLKTNHREAIVRLRNRGT